MADLEPTSGGVALRRYRAAAGLTQEELAERAGLSARAIRAIESGNHRTPRKDTINLLATALGLTSSERNHLEMSMRRAPISPAPRTSPTPRRARPPLVGRQREQALLRRALTDAGPPLTLLTGEPGIGKSRLLQELSEQAESLGWTVVSAKCHRRSALQPYAPIVDALASLLASRSPTQRRQDAQGCSWLARLLPEMVEHTPVLTRNWTLPTEQERRLMFMATARYLANVAGSTGTLLVLDDLQWAGVDALDLLSFLARQPISERSLRIVGAYRDTDVVHSDPLPMMVSDLAREDLALCAPMPPLDQDDAAQLLTTLLSDDSPLADDVRARALSRSGGVPFFLVCCALDARNKPLHPDGVRDVPWSAAESIRQRASLLTEPADDILSIAVVAERPIPRDMLVNVMGELGHSERSTLRALEMTARARLLMERADGAFTFTHDLIRDTLDADIGGARRAILHRYIANALERQPLAVRRADELAWRFSQSGEIVRAIPYALRAGDQAEASYAHHDAERHYRAALEWSESMGDRQTEAEALEKLAEVEYRIARYREAYAHLERAIFIYHADQNWERMAWATAQIARAGDPLGKTAESLERLNTLFPQLAAVASGEAPPEAASARSATHDDLMARAERATAILTPKTAARVYLCLMSRYLFLGRHREAIEPGEQAKRYAQQANDLRIESLAHSFHGQSQLAQGEIAKARAALALGRERALQSGDLEALYVALEGAIEAHESQAEPVQAHAALLEMLQTGQQLGDSGYTSDTRCGLAAFAFLLGRWDEARMRLADALNDVRRQSQPPWRMPMPVMALLNLVHDGAMPSDIEPAEPSRDGAPWVWAIASLAERDLLAGNVSAATALLQSAADTLADAPRCQLYLLAPLALVALARGRRADAQELLQQARDRAMRLRNRMALVDIERVWGALALADGHLEDAATALERSLAMCQAAPFPYAEAKARLIFGEVYSAMGKRDQAREQFGVALDICEQLGERAYRAHIEEVRRDCQ